MWRNRIHKFRKYAFFWFKFKNLHRTVPITWWFYIHKTFFFQKNACNMYFFNWKYYLIIGPWETFPEDLWDLSVRPWVRPDDYGKSSERILMKFGIDIASLGQNLETLIAVFWILQNLAFWAKKNGCFFHIF